MWAKKIPACIQSLWLTQSSQNEELGDSSKVTFFYRPREKKLSEEKQLLPLLMLRMWLWSRNIWVGCMQAFSVCSGHWLKGHIASGWGQLRGMVLSTEHIYVQFQQKKVICKEMVSSNMPTSCKRTCSSFPSPAQRLQGLGKAWLLAASLLINLHERPLLPRAFRSLKTTSHKWNKTKPHKEGPCPGTGRVRDHPTLRWWCQTPA